MIRRGRRGGGTRRRVALRTGKGPSYQRQGGAARTVGCGSDLTLRGEAQDFIAITDHAITLPELLVETRPRQTGPQQNVGVPGLVAIARVQAAILRSRSLFVRFVHSAEAGRIWVIMYCPHSRLS